MCPINYDFFLFGLVVYLFLASFRRESREVSWGSRENVHFIVVRRRRAAQKISKGIRSTAANERSSANARNGRLGGPSSIAKDSFNSTASSSNIANRKILVETQTRKKSTLPRSKNGEKCLEQEDDKDKNNTVPEDQFTSEKLKVNLRQRATKIKRPVSRKFRNSMVSKIPLFFKWRIGFTGYY